MKSSPRHPPYHLRVNKAVDRFMLVEVLEILKRYCQMSDYTYYGFGGPFLEDCKLVYDRCPEVRIVSIEQDEQTLERQEFHRFSKNLDLIQDDFSNFLEKFSGDTGEIFWLDYTDRELIRFKEFQSLLGKVSDNSVVKITIRAERDWQKVQDFQQQYSEIVPRPIRRIDMTDSARFVKLLQDMFHTASIQALPEAGGSVFQLLDSSYYKDTSQMLSITGIICNKDKVLKIRKWFKDWKFANLDWEAPRKINVPDLSVKERLYLERYLPTTEKTGVALSRALGYRIDEDEKHIEQLKQYEEFHQYYPYFARVLF